MIISVVSKRFVIIAILLILLHFFGYSVSSAAISHWRAIETEFMKDPYNYEYVVYAVEEAKKGAWDAHYLHRYDALALFKVLVSYGAFIDYEHRYEAAVHVAQHKKGSAVAEYCLALELFYALVERGKAYEEAASAAEEGVSRGRKDVDGVRLRDKALELLYILVVRDQAFELAARIVQEEGVRYVSIQVLHLLRLLISVGYNEESFIAQSIAIMQRGLQSREREIEYAAVELQETLKGRHLLSGGC